jgi:hypothetical protein
MNAPMGMETPVGLDNEAHRHRPGSVPAIRQLGFKGLKELRHDFLSSGPGRGELGRDGHGAWHLGRLIAIIV